MPSSIKRLLFVDDEEFVLRGMKRILSLHQERWDMTFVTSGDAALAELERGGFDVIVSDMRMPRMDGATLLNRVARDHPRTVRIALSGYADRELILRCVGAAHQYLVKPCDAATLEGAILRIESLLKRDRAEVVRLVARCPVLPVVPEMYSQLTALLQDPACSIEQIAGVIAHDTAMTAQILKLVNSAFFGLGREIADPAEAAQYLGVETIKTLVLGAHLFKPLNRDLPEGVSIDRFLRHAQACAAQADRVVDLLEGDRAERHQAYVACLLHDIGKLLLAVNQPEDYARAIALARAESLPLTEAERRIFGADHADVGAYFLGLHGLPLSIVESVARHHDPSFAVEAGGVPLAALHVANLLAEAETPAIENLPASRPDPAFMAAHGLNEILARLSGAREADGAPA